MNDQDRPKTHPLERDGWTRQFIACEPRLSEAVELYRETGHEVHLEPLTQETLSDETGCTTCEGDPEENECRICFKGVEDQYKIIYTRPLKETTDL